MKKIILIIAILLASIATANAALQSTAVVNIDLVNQDPDPAMAGKIVEVRLGVENSGGEAANDLLVEVVPEYPFVQLEGESLKQLITTIKPLQTGENMKILKYRLKLANDAPAGSYQLKVQYRRGEGASAQKTVMIDVKSKESAEVIHIDKTVLVPGDESSLKFTINNVGNTPLDSMTFSWINEDEILLPVGSDNTKFIQYIDIGESVEVEYNVIADTSTAAGLYKLDLTLEYDDPISGAARQIRTIAGIYIGGGTDFDVAFSESTDGETSFSIANIGSNPASSVSVIIPKQSGWMVSGSNSMIIGNLNKGDYTVASFNLQQIGGDRSKDSKATPSNEIEVEIAYTNTMGERDTIKKEVELNLRSAGMNITSFNGMRGGKTMPQKESFLSQYKWYFITIAAVILFFGVRKWYKKKKLLDPKFGFRKKKK